MSDRCKECGMDLPGTQLGRAIRRAGYSYTEFSNASGIGRGKLVHWVCGGNYPSKEEDRATLYQLLPGLTDTDLRHPWVKTETEGETL